MQVGMTKDQGLYNKPSAVVHPGAFTTIQFIHSHTQFYITSISSRVEKTGITIRLRLDGKGVRIPTGTRDFIPSTSSRPDWGPPTLLFNRYRGPFPSETRPKRKVNRSPSPSAKIKNEWSHASNPLYAAMT